MPTLYAATASSEPLHCVITDDDPLSRRVLEGHISQTPSLLLDASLHDGLQLLDYVKSHPPIDLLFLDLEMPLLNGLDLLRLFPRLPAVVLTTSHADFAVEAFALRVVDYLVKPIEFTRFYQAVVRVREWRVRLSPATPPMPAPTLPVSAPVKNEAPSLEKALFLKRGSSLVRIDYDEIVYVEAVRDRTVVVTTQQQYSSNLLLHEVTSRLPTNQFARVHRTYVVNRRQIEGIRNSTLLLKGGREVPVGRTYLKDLMASLQL